MTRDFVGAGLGAPWLGVLWLAAGALSVSAAASPQPSPIANQPATGSAPSPDAGSEATDEQSSGGPTSHGSTFAANQLVGQITKIDPDSRLLTIHETKTTRTLKLGDDTTVFVEGRLGTAQDLKEGQQVRAAFETRGGQQTLRWIEVAPAASAPAASAEAPVQQPSPTPPVTGTVVTNDPATPHVVVRQGSTQVTLDVNENTRVMLNGQASSRAAIKEGQQVRASFDPSGRFVSVMEITTTNPRAKAGSSAPPQPPDTTY